MEIDQLKEKAKEARKLVIEMLAEAGSGHTAGPLGMADIFTAFYSHILKHDPKNPEWTERDRLFLSNGHICPIQYAVLALAGYFPVEELKTLRKLDSRLQGHPEKGRLSGIESTSGPLGLGLGQASGYALSAKIDRKDFRIFCLMSDGEQDEGNIWESAMFATKYKLDNLIAVIDRNGIQISGKTEDVMPIEPLVLKYQLFGWQVFECDGNNIEEFIEIIEEAKKVKGKPTVIVAHTVSGKGVVEIENDYRWHGRVPTKEEAERFIKELN
jgi:transketolase